MSLRDFCERFKEQTTPLPFEMCFGTTNEAVSNRNPLLREKTHSAFIDCVVEMRGTTKEREAVFSVVCEYQARYTQ